MQALAKWLTSPTPDGLDLTGRQSAVAGTTEPFATLTLADWVFTALTCLAVLWAFNILFEISAGLTADYLPLAAGIPILALGWRTSQVGDKVKAAIEGLGAGAGLSEGGNIAAFRTDLQRLVRVWSFRAAAGLGIIVTSFLSWAVWDGRLDNGTTQNTLVLLTSGGVSILVGVLLGRLLGYARLLDVMADHSVAIASVETPQARSALRAIESVYIHSLISTAAMCVWFVPWYAAWAFGIDTNGYRELYQLPFLALWAVSLFFFVFAGRRSSLAFRARLDALQGGEASRATHVAQAKQADADLTAAKGKAEFNREFFLEARELRQLVDDLALRRLAPRIPNALVVNALTAVLSILFLAGLILTLLRLPPVAEIGAPLSEAVGARLRAR